MTTTDKTILITGASQGIGRHLAIHFAPKAKHLVLTARNESNLQQTAQMVRDAGGTCSVHAIDLRDAQSLQRLTKALQQDGLAVDILINNAADVTSKPLLETSLDEIDSLVSTNVTGCLQLCRLIAPTMVQHGAGMIINISSLAGYKSNPQQTAYSATKTAVNGISDALRAELGPKGIHIMNIALASVAAQGEPKPGQMPAPAFAQRLEQAIAANETELFLSPITKWLMRLYRFYPPLMNLR